MNEKLIEKFKFELSELKKVIFLVELLDKNIYASDLLEIDEYINEVKLAPEHLTYEFADVRIINSSGIAITVIELLSLDGYITLHLIEAEIVNIFKNYNQEITSEMLSVIDENVREYYQLDTFIEDIKQKSTKLSYDDNKNIAKFFNSLNIHNNLKYYILVSYVTNFLQDVKYFDCQIQESIELLEKKITTAQIFKYMYEPVISYKYIGDELYTTITYSSEFELDNGVGLLFKNANFLDILEGYVFELTENDLLSRNEQLGIRELILSVFIIECLNNQALDVLKQLETENELFDLEHLLRLDSNQLSKIIEMYKIDEFIDEHIL